VKGIPTSDVHRGGLAATVSMAFQNPDHQLFSPTVEEEVGFAPGARGYTQSRRKELVEWSLDLLQISGLRKLNPFNLSMGQRHMVALAATFAQDAEAIILDEPTLGLDRSSRESLGTALKELASDGRAVLVITHDLDWAWEYASIVALMDEGKIVGTGDVELLASVEALRLNCSPQLALLGKSFGGLFKRTHEELAEAIKMERLPSGGVR